MVKKLFSIISILLVSASLFAARSVTYKEDLTNCIQFYGYLNEYCTLNITGLNQSGNVGMPFSIMDSSVSYNASDIRLGREIASWSLSTNASEVKIIIKPEPLICEDDETKFFNYYLTFRYEYADAKTGKDLTGYIVAHSDATSPVVINKTTTATASDFNSVTNNYVELSNKASDDSTLPIISINKDVRFMLDKAYSSTEFDNYPDGYYYAKVKIQVEGK